MRAYPFLRKNFPSLALFAIADINPVGFGMLLSSPICEITPGKLLSSVALFSSLAHQGPSDGVSFAVARFFFVVSPFSPFSRLFCVVGSVYLLPVIQASFFPVPWPIMPGFLLPFTLPFHWFFVRFDAPPPFFFDPGVFPRPSRYLRAIAGVCCLLAIVKFFLSLLCGCLLFPPGVDDVWAPLDRGKIFFSPGVERVGAVSTPFEYLLVPFSWDFPRLEAHWKHPVAFPWPVLAGDGFYLF